MSVILPNTHFWLCIVAVFPFVKTDVMYNMCW